MAYVNITGANVPHQDVLFFLQEFQCLATPLGCHLNPAKTRIMTSTSGKSSLPAIKQDYGHAVADSVRQALATYSVSSSIAADGTTVSLPVEITDGLRILGQPLGSRTYALSFFNAQLKENLLDATKLFNTITDHHTALRLFIQCTLHKLPHLLGSEVLYCFAESSYNGWNEWIGPLSVEIDRMVEASLAKLTQRSSLNPNLLLIAYLSIAQGGLGLMDAYSLAIPDLVITMSQSICYAREGLSFSHSATPHLLPTSLSALFNATSNPTSIFMTTFNRLLPDVCVIGAPPPCADPINYFLKRGPLKSARNRIRVAASTLRRTALYSIARPGLLAVLSKILIASSSYPIIGMSRSVPSHRRPNNLFIINLKMKLYLELFHPSNCPSCLCGKTIDPFGMHTFYCTRVSKKIIHDRI